MSLTIWSKSAVPSGWKTIADCPALLRPIPVSSVTPAVLMAYSRSAAGCLILRLPVRTSKRPMGPRLRLALELRLEALEGGDPLLHRRVGREQARDRALDARREEVERAQLAGGPQVLLRDAVHAAVDPHERRGERAGATRDEGGAAVGRELAVARERLHEEEGDDV